MPKKVTGLAPRLFAESTQKRGLLLNSVDPGQSRTPTRDCGVSLDFLERICRTIEDVRDESGLHNESTSAAMQRILMPAHPGR